MNKKHIVNIKESLLFLSICRNTLCEMYDNKDLKYFIENKASDYQIISIIVSNKIPEEKYNLKEEYKQWGIFQQTIGKNSKLFVEMGPIIEYGLSSCKPIYEHLIEANDQQDYVQGLYKKMNKAMKVVKTDLSKVDANTSLNKVAVDSSAGTAASVIKFTAAKLYKDYLSKAVLSCKGRPDKIECIKQFKARALEMRIGKLRSGMSICTKAKNQDACKRSIQNQLDKLQAKAEK